MIATRSRLDLSPAWKDFYIKYPGFFPTFRNLIHSIFLGHIKNSYEIIKRLCQLPTDQLRQNRYAYNLDVVLIDITLPAHSAVNLLIDYIVASGTAAALRQSLSITVDNIYFSFHDHTYKQTTGLPMGSSHSGLLGITYMNHLERRTLNICYSCAFFTRYADDIFILTSSHAEADIIFLTFNSVDVNMQSSIEHPDNTESLSLVDFQLKITEEREIHAEFYRKTAGRDKFLHHNSALSLSTKIVYARNVLTRI